jgi:ribonuclease D
MQPAIIATAGPEPAIEHQPIATRFGSDRGEYLYATDPIAAADALGWVLEAATSSPMSDRLSVGIDIETTSLAPGDGRIRLAQIAAGDRCVVLDCFAFDAWDALHHTIAGLEIGWIAHNAEFEQSWLARHGGFTLTPMFDTRWVFVRERARRTGVYDPHGSNLARVCEELLGFELSKKQRLSDWSTPALSAAQVEYGALDALVLLPLRERLEREALDNGWVAEVGAAAERSAAEALRFS